MNFTKMEGLGNDFVLLEGPRHVTPSDVALWCSRRRGIGADGVLVALGHANEVGMEYYNADGGAAELCGNGLRCVARYAFDRGWAPSRDFIVSSSVGSHRVSVLDDGLVRAQLGAYRLGERIDVAERRIATVSVGNPHAVLIVDDPDREAVHQLGPRIETDQAFPDGTNVEFASIDADGIHLRVWERGVGETLACGTGAAAAVAVAHEMGKIGSTAPVHLRGGELQVDLLDGDAWITGPAEYVFEGTWSSAVRA